MVTRERMHPERQSGRERFDTEEIRSIVDRLETETGDTSITQSIHFSTGVLNRLERQFTLGCTIVTDTKLILPGLDRQACALLPVKVECLIDSPMVVNFATQRRVTRAEIATERALAVMGAKVLVVGSAPMALQTILHAAKQSPVCETTVIATPSGFANVVALKEQLWESGIPCVVMRGRCGGATAAISITNALLRYAAAKVR